MTGEESGAFALPGRRPALNGARVKRLHRDLVVSPELVAQTPGARLQLMCRRCMVPRDLDVRRASKLKRVWTYDLERVFHRITFRCRCGLHAHALRVTRPTRDGSEVLLLVEPAQHQRRLIKKSSRRGS